MLEQPEFQRLLSGRPESIFLTPNKFLNESTRSNNPNIYELRIHTATKGQLVTLQKSHREQVVGLHFKHGIRDIGSWFAYDRPESENTLYTLLRHTARKQADLNWKALESDPMWKKVSANGKLIHKTERLYLKPLEFSPLK